MIVVGIDPSYARTGVATTGDTRSITPPARTAQLWPLARAATRLIDPWHGSTLQTRRDRTGMLPQHRLRALDPYRPPWTRRHPDPWIRHLGDRP